MAKTKGADTRQRDALLEILRARFEKNVDRHPDIDWSDVMAKVQGKPEKLRSLSEMERTGGEPDVVVLDANEKRYTFVDCSPESPKGRRSVCYDRDARVKRKEHAPKNSAMEMAAAMGIELLTEEQYRALQKIGEFDTKTSSWVMTPPGIRDLGGAIFCDRRYDQVFTYHNGAESYYAARGFRGVVEV